MEVIRAGVLCGLGEIVSSPERSSVLVESAPGTKNHLCEGSGYVV